MRTVTIANQKGGVGKTTTAVNLAVGLGLAGKRVLVVDMDPQANATFSLVGYAQPVLTVYDLLIRGRDLEDVTQRQVQENVDLVPSDIDLAGAEVELLSAIGGQQRLANRLQGMNVGLYDFVIIDAPPSLGLLTINALAAADEVLVPISTSVFALKGIAELQGTIDLVRENLNRPTLRIGGILCTMADNTNVANDILTTVRAEFGKLVFETVIPKNVKVEEAHSRSQSVLTYAPGAAGAMAYTNLVEEVLARG